MRKAKKISKCSHICCNRLSLEDQPGFDIENNVFVSGNIFANRKGPPGQEEAVVDKPAMDTSEGGRSPGHHYLDVSFVEGVQNFGIGRAIRNKQIDFIDTT